MQQKNVYSNSCCGSLLGAVLLALCACDGLTTDDGFTQDEERNGGERLGELDVAPDLKLTEFDDGSRRYRASSLRGAQALQRLVEAGEVAMGEEALAQLRANVGETEADDSSPRAYGPCQGALPGQATALVKRTWAWAGFSGWIVTATAKWQSWGFSPQVGARAEAVVCVGEPCMTDVKLGTSVNAAAHGGQPLIDGPSAFALARVENLARTCYFAFTADYWE